jgi:hypothetical protein
MDESQSSAMKAAEVAERIALSRHVDGFDSEGYSYLPQAPGNG